MYYKPKEDEEIKYFDVCSLYPYVLCKPYPVGHPKDVLRDAKMNEWEWDHPSDHSYRGLIKCVVVPPPNLLVPVLPMRDAGRLVFPLCRQCTIDSRQKDAHGLKQCTHSDKKRSFTTTTTHVELDQALLMGYKVRGVIEIWHWDQWDSEIFSSYIKTFYKVKQEAT
ncbi:DNA polymerase, partial [Aphelenchoides avenae]